VESAIRQGSLARRTDARHRRHDYCGDNDRDDSARAHVRLLVEKLKTNDSDVGGRGRESARDSSPSIVAKSRRSQAGVHLSDGQVVADSKTQAPTTFTSGAYDAANSGLPTGRPALFTAVRFSAIHSRSRAQDRRLSGSLEVPAARARAQWAMRLNDAQVATDLGRQVL
jgi:hypothetical protein